MKDSKEPLIAPAKDNVLFFSPDSGRVPSIVTGKSASATIVTGVANEEEAKIQKDLDDPDPAINMIRKMRLLDRYASSTKLLLLFGKSTYLETYTPDADGNLSDNYGGTGKKGSFIGRFLITDLAQHAKDIQSAIEDPEHNLKVLSAVKMRK